MDHLVIEHDESTLTVSGEVDILTAAQLGDALQQALPNVRLDLSGCSFMDSTGISVLVRASTEAESAGGRLTIVAVSDAVGRVLELCGLSHLLGIHESGTTA